MKTAYTLSPRLTGLFSMAIFLAALLAPPGANAQERRGRAAAGTDRRPAREAREAATNRVPQREIREPLPSSNGASTRATTTNRVPRQNRTTITRNNRTTPANTATERARPNEIADRRGTSNNNNARPSNGRPAYGTASRPAYRPVYGYNQRPVYNPRNPGWRYGYLPRRNSYFYGLPSSYLSIQFGGIGYRYWNGVYYRPYNNLFTVIAPPIGIYINVLPVGYRRIMVRSIPYYYFNGTYYQQRENNYHVVSPPLGAVVESLPVGYETVVIDGETFYTIDGAQYKPVVQENGEIWYEVIKAN